MSDAYTSLEQLIYQAVSGSRFTQGSPVMADVWIRYGAEEERQDLLLVPNWRSTSADLARALEERLVQGVEEDQRNAVLAQARLAYTQNAVAVTLDLRQLVRVTLPLSLWWNNYLLEPREGVPEGDLAALLAHPTYAARLRESLLRGLEGKPFELDLEAVPAAQDGEEPRQPRHVTADLVWLARVVGTLVLLRQQAPGASGPSEIPKRLKALHEQHEAVLDAFLEVVKELPAPPPGQEPLWSVNRNRSAGLAIYESMSTIKADAARQVFNVTGVGIRWAVVDSGIDARHLAFRRRNADGTLVSRLPFEPRSPEAAPRDASQWKNHTRVVATYDFTSARTLLSARNLDMVPPPLRATLEARGVTQQQLLLALERRPGRSIDWELWDPIFRIPHTREGYEKPPHKHGTHVAGILAADWRPEDSRNDALAEERAYMSSHRGNSRTGVCPEIELYDIRVMEPNGESNEFALLTALQFIRALNARHEHVEIHGANLSFSLMHDVSNHACGRTPICEECERLVGNGVVVVAAAGNQGRARYFTTEGRFDEGYRSISITDPGNAPSVITVGATHRSEPHGYGVSYFSSRGPTGDGRLKPDLVAPGEKIVSTVPDNREEPLDGTSMAAPHVSGAAALLLCRHPEFIGKPAEIKRILCQTAIDLGRERYFQGAGLLDILHALESV
jgi:subtilisin family serine protease